MSSCVLLCSDEAEQIMCKIFLQKKFFLKKCCLGLWGIKHSLIKRNPKYHIIRPFFNVKKQEHENTDEQLPERDYGFGHPNPS